MLVYPVLAVSGYKPHELGIFQEKHEQLPFLKMAIKRKLIQLIEEYVVEWIVTSGQPGVELWAAEAALQLSEDTYPHLKVATLAPFYNQEERWNDAVKQLYHFVCMNSHYHDYITKRPYDSPQQLRLKNQFIIDKSDAFLVLYDEYTEGSPIYYLREAKKKADATNYPIFYLTPEDIEDMIRDYYDEYHTSDY